MSENKAPESAAKDPDVGKTLAEIKKAVLPEPKKPSGPSAEAIAAARKVLEDAERASEGPNFGEGLDGTKTWTVPPLAKHLGFVSVSTTKKIKNREGKMIEVPFIIEYKPGSTHEVTADQLNEIRYRMNKLRNHEMSARFGEGMAKRITMDVTGGNSVVAGKNGSESY